MPIIKRWISFVLTIAILAQNSCAGYRETALLKTESSFLWGGCVNNGAQVSLISALVDDDIYKNLADHPGLFLFPGPHKIKITARWSNDWVDATDLQADLAARQTYLLLFYEAHLGQDLATADISPKQAWTLIADSFVFMFFPLIAIGYVLPMTILQKEPEPPTARPFENCCFLWIENQNTGEVIAGKRPGGSSTTRALRSH
jgi:hypothetical protein